MIKLICLNFLSMIFFYNCQTAERATIIMPIGFKGDVTIIFNQKNGSSTKYENGRRIYEIPSDGVLITKFTSDYGFTDFQYYYIDSLKNKVMLRKFSNAEESKLSNVIGIFGSGTMGTYGNSGDSNSIEYLEFSVSNYEYLNTISTKEYKNKFRQKIVEKVGHDF